MHRPEERQGRRQQQERLGHGGLRLSERKDEGKCNGHTEGGREGGREGRKEEERENKCRIKKRPIF